MLELSLAWWHLDGSLSKPRSLLFAGYPFANLVLQRVWTPPYVRCRARHNHPSNTKLRTRLVKSVYGLNWPANILARDDGM